MALNNGNNNGGVMFDDILNYSFINNWLAKWRNKVGKGNYVELSVEKSNL